MSGIILKCTWDSPKRRNQSHKQYAEYITRGLDDHEQSLLNESIEWSDILDDMETNSSQDIGFSRYINYLERHDVTYHQNDKEITTRKSNVLATQNGLETKSGNQGLFDNIHDVLSEKQRQQYSNHLERAYQEGGLMWKPIISFESEWLLEQKIVENGVVDEEKLKVATRDTMKSLLKDTHLQDNHHWIGQIHYDTDNIHIHVAMVEKNIVNTMELTSDEEKNHGFIAQKSIKQSKSTLVRSLSDRGYEKQQINDMMRKRIIGVTKESTLKETHEDLFKTLSSKLSTYQYEKLKPHEKKWLLSFSKELLETKFASEYHQFKTLVHQEQDFYRKTYGEKSKDMYRDYADNQEKDLLKRMSNTILKQIKTYKNEEQSMNKLLTEMDSPNKVLQSKESERDQSRSFSFHNKEVEPKRNSLSELNQVDYHLSKVNQELKRDVQKALNEHEKLLNKIEHEKQYEGASYEF